MTSNVLNVDFTEKPTLPNHTLITLTSKGRDELLYARTLNAAARRFLLTLDTRPTFGELRLRPDLLPTTSTFTMLADQGYLIVHDAQTDAAIPAPRLSSQVSAQAWFTAPDRPVFYTILSSVERDITTLFDKEAPPLVDKLYRLQTISDLMQYITKLRGILAIYHDTDVANAFELRALQKLSAAS